MSKRLTHEEWFERYKHRINSSIEILGSYTSSRDKILVKCKVCGKEYFTLPNVIISGCMCKNCSIAKTKEQFEAEVFNLHPNICILENYKKDNIKIKVKCYVCNHEWYATPTHLLRGHGCPKCARKRSGLLHRLSQVDFENKLKINNPSIECIGTYNGTEKKVLVRSKICGHSWRATPNNLIYNKSGCPICHMSHGEREIHMFLEGHAIDFIPQYAFDNLIGLNNGLLSYDFYLPNYNLLIEYQGEYHDGTVCIQTVEELAIQQEHDRRKRNYALDNNIDLLEIWYWDYNNIEQILNIKLNIDIKEVS